MKRTRTKPKTSEELRPEYDFSYAQARPNRFASGMKRPIVAVVLEPDVAEVFHSSDSVNRILRSVISALPRGERKKTTERSRRKAG